MVWYCELCKKEVDVLAEKLCSSTYSGNATIKEIEQDLYEGETTIRCNECDSPHRVVWK